jgi:hypothetical protein
MDIHIQPCRGGRACPVSVNSFLDTFGHNIMLP